MLTVDVPAARAALGAARPGADPVGPAGRRPRGAAAGARAARRRARPRAGRRAARAADRRAAPGPGPRVDRRPRRSRAQRPPGVRATPVRVAAGRPRRPARRARRACSSSRASEPVFAVVTGEPGIGKSRLCAELAATARREGATVLVGRCSQDEGAPPLYPWASVLRGLGHDLPSGLGGRGRRRQRLAVPGVGVDRPHGARRGSRTGTCSSSSTTCTGPTPRPCGCCGCSPRPPTPGG